MIELTGAAKYVAAIIIHLIVPALGILAFAVLNRRMARAQIASPPTLSYLNLFVTFGGWLFLTLTILFWEWSGMASIGFMFLVCVSPIVTAVLTVNLHRQRQESSFHRYAFAASFSYILIVGLAALVLILWALWTKWAIEAKG
jgi:hypothetical protein